MPYCVKPTCINSIFCTIFQVIARHSVDKAGQIEFQDTDVEKILKLLFNHCESEEEGVRNVVAECLGKIALIEPKKLVPALKVYFQPNEKLS